MIAFVSVFGIMSCAKVPPGYVGLKVKMSGDDKGSITEKVPGYYFNMNPMVSYYTFPTFVKTYKWTAGKDEGSPTNQEIVFSSSEGLKISCDIGVTLSVNGEKGQATRLFESYREGIDEITDGYVRNAVRDAFNIYGVNYPADKIVGDGKAQLIGDVKKYITDKFAPMLIVDDVSYLSNPRPPESVEDAINLKVKATQTALQKQQEVVSAQADAQKAVAAAQGEADSIKVKAEAQAEANRKLASSLTPELVKAQWIDRWDGKLPTVAGSGATILNYSDLK